MNWGTAFIRLLREAFGYRFMEVIEDSPTHVTIRSGRITTTFDRLATKIVQNGRLVGMMDLIENVVLHQPLNQEGPPNWYITVHIAGRRQVEIGQVTDEIDASIVGARISKITGRPVVIGK
jgi:hypothetical protein